MPNWLVLSAIEYFAFINLQSKVLVHILKYACIPLVLPWESPWPLKSASTICDLFLLPQIEFTEFCQLMIKYGTQKDDDLRDAFKVFDQDNNGYIDAAELQTILSNMGENLPMDQVSLFAMLQRARFILYHDGSVSCWSWLKFELEITINCL